jgi:hypothetical protein
MVKIENESLVLGDLQTRCKK